MNGTEEKQISLRRMDATQFDWLTWRAGSIWDMLSIPQREYHLTKNKATLVKYAVGWCPAEELICRPKTDCMAVMFHFNGVDFWTHLTNKEFNTIFAESNR